MNLTRSDGWLAGWSVGCITKVCISYEFYDCECVASSALNANIYGNNDHESEVERERETETENRHIRKCDGHYVCGTGEFMKCVRHRICGSECADTSALLFWHFRSASHINWAWLAGIKPD